ncbi:alpha/beta-hydrolase [Staphylotrichum tortipilum]|uniref:Alpha/beta-hydrolase n=1 Tax=Staphylotrichum tortipilum TaxID=2831512 RepID=A0AAN6RXP7_9PEZI|nr:alpha/beta-hydrolase [Staphylotrichum longicolle]
MRLLSALTWGCLLPHLADAEAIPRPPPPPPQPQEQQPISLPPQPSPGLQPQKGISPSLFASLERTARLVDITYCVGTSGITPPFTCVSRCKDFPSLRLVKTWNTGVLLSDSCGFIAVDEGGGEGYEDAGALAEALPGDGRAPEIVVAFRGTYSVTNTIVDLSTVPQEYVPYPGDDPSTNTTTPKCANCTVHTGFLASWHNTRSAILPALLAARARHPRARVHLVGHSLGGAVAALAALELRVGLGWGDDVQVTTFGEPRVGNGGLAGYIDAAFGLGGEPKKGEELAYRRMTHVGDPVPLLPLSEWGYRSHGGEVYIGRSELPPGVGDVRLCRGDRDPECIGGAETEDWLGWFLGGMRRGRKTEVGVEDEVRAAVEVEEGKLRPRWFPARFKLWQLFFAHRDYFWRLGLCLPGGDPVDWGREKYNLTTGEAVVDGTGLGDL